MADGSPQLHVHGLDVFVNLGSNSYFCHSHNITVHSLLSTFSKTYHL